jgi:hypothetical protein
MPSTYEPIQTTTLTSAIDSVTFTSIPNTYTDLVIVANSKNATSNANYLGFRYNSDSGSNYGYVYTLGSGTSPALSGVGTTQSFGRYGNGSTASFQVSFLNIFNYANTNVFKTSISQSNSVGNYSISYTSTWRSTAAITSVQLFTDAGNWVVDSVFTLYGIKAA